MATVRLLAVVEWASFGSVSLGIGAAGYAVAGLAGGLAGGFIALGVSGFYLANTYVLPEPTEEGANAKPSADSPQRR